MNPAVELLTLGCLDVLDGQGKRIDALAGQQKRLGLLVYLAIESVGGPIERDRVCAVFWPDRDNERARGNLRNVLHFLRSVLPQEAVVVIGDERLQIDPEVVSCDAAEALRRGTRVSPGQFLEGVNVRGAGVDFYDWVERVRAELETHPQEPASAGRVVDSRAPERIAAPEPPHAPAATPPGGERAPRPATSRTGRWWGAGALAALTVSVAAVTWDIDSESTDTDATWSSEVAVVDRSRRVLLVPFLAEGALAVPDEVMGPGSYWLTRRIGASGIAGVIDYSTLQARLGDPSRVDLLEAADSAYADYVVVGHVRVARDSVTVTPRIVRAGELGTELSLPAESAPLDDPLAAWDRAAERVIAALGAELSPTWRWPPHSPPPTLAILRLEKDAHDAFYETDYARFHVLADSARTLDTSHRSYPMLNLQASAFWNQRTVNPLNFRKADSTLTYMESLTEIWSPGEQRGLQWMRSIVGGDLVSEFEAASSPSIAEASDRSPYRLAMSARRTNRLDLALALIDKRFLMHPRATGYRAWDAVHLSTLARGRDFRAMIEVAEIARSRAPNYGLYSLRAAQAYAALGDMHGIRTVIDRSRTQPITDAFNPLSHLVEAAKVAYAEGWRDEARSLATEALEEASNWSYDADPRWPVAEAHVVLGEWDAAVDRLEELGAESVPIETRVQRVGLYGVALAAAGRDVEAAAAIRTLEEIAEEYERFYLEGWARWHAARIHARLGEADAAIRTIALALDSGRDHDEWEVWDIHLLPLHNEPGYRELTRIRP